MILVTGAAGFIGYHVSKKLIDLKHDVLLVDDLSNEHEGITAERQRMLGRPVHPVDIQDLRRLLLLCEGKPIDTVIHLAAIPGVRKGPETYTDYVANNVMGTVNILELCRRHEVPVLLYASSSSVYGDLPMSEAGRGKCKSVYSATKRSCEHLAEAYAHLHGIKCFGMRFFTVYGPWGRPDMAYYSFTNAIRNGMPLTIHPGMMRDMTQVDDVVNAILCLRQASYHLTGHRTFNIGTGRWASVEDLVEILEHHLHRNAVVRSASSHPADVRWTLADNSEMVKIGWTPQTDLVEGLGRFCEWHKGYHRD